MGNRDSEPRRRPFIFGRGTNGDPADIHVADNTNLVVVKTGGARSTAGTGSSRRRRRDPPSSSSILLFNAANLKGISIFPAGTKLAPNPQMTIPARAFTLQSGTAFSGAVLKSSPASRLKGGVVLSNRLIRATEAKRAAFNLYWR